MDALDSLHLAAERQQRLREEAELHRRAVFARREDHVRADDTAVMDAPRALHPLPGHELPDDVRQPPAA